MFTLNVRIEFQEKPVFQYLDDHVDEDKKEPTDLEAEAGWLCIDFIRTYPINDRVDSIWTKDKKVDKLTKYILTEYIKHLVYLKRHDHNLYEKLEEESSYH